MDEMSEKLLKNEIPTKAGNEYSESLTAFEEMVNKTDLSEENNKKLKQHFKKLEGHKDAGLFEDQVLRGLLIDNRNQKERTAILIDMVRTSGFLRGVCASIKADKIDTGLTVKKIKSNDKSN
ncbi:MAG: hypothetical protein HC846_12125 [Blastocatellia bacterium]|nr:hypothetical protein [Blastocatellia bacterium]